jgi:hypothetical protein
MGENPNSDGPADAAPAERRRPDFAPLYFALIGRIARIADLAGQQAGEATRDALNDLVDQALVARALPSQDPDNGTDP